MIIVSFSATKVHGYLDLDLEFDEKLTFVTGLNGSGKTSALSLLIALLTPNLETLSKIEYAQCMVTGRTAEGLVTIYAKRVIDGIELCHSWVSDKLSVTHAEIERIREARLKGDGLPRASEVIIDHIVYKTIQKVATPIFLDLERKVVVADRSNSLSLEQRRRKLALRGSRLNDSSNSKQFVWDGLWETHQLIYEKQDFINSQISKLDAKLRENLYRESFKYISYQEGSDTLTLPNKKELDRIQGQMKEIRSEFEGKDLFPESVQNILTDFLEHMGTVIVNLNIEISRGLMNKKKSGEDKESEIDNKYLFDWLVNQNHLIKVREMISLMQMFIDDKKKLNQPVENFANLINSFFEQTGKRISVLSYGDISIELKGYPDSARVTQLSSGEKQLLTLLANLSLNPVLDSSGVFIIDEPEVSLHLAWQEMFVTALQSANSKVQIILATHSPAIVAGRLSNCRSLSEGKE